LDIGAPGEFDDGRVCESFVLRDGDTYYLFHMVDHYPYSYSEQIALATTSAADFPLGPGGGNWTKHGLILPHNPDPTAWDSGLTADPSVIKVNATFYMLYTGSYANEAWKLGIAYSDSPFGPWTRPDSPSLVQGPPGSWDDDRLLRGAIHYHNGKYIMPYTGNNGSMYRGGIATADPLDELIDFETRTSPDGSTWEEWKPVLNGSTIQSSPNTYVQYRATLHSGSSPTLTSVKITYQTEGTPSNTPPVASNLAITPPFPYTTDDLVGSYTYFDAEGTPESGTEIRWYNNGVLQLAYNDALTVSSSSTTTGEVWYFTVRPSDGEDFGDLKTSPSVTIADAPPPSNLVQNPSVENDSNSDGVPDCWVRFTMWGKDVPGNLVWDTDAHSGSRSLRINEGPNSTAPQWHYLAWKMEIDLNAPAYIPLVRGQTYALRCWYKTLNGSAHLRIRMFNANWVDIENIDSGPLHSTVWTQTSWINFTVPQEARWLQIEFAMRLSDIDPGATQASIWADDFEVYET